MWRMLLIVLAVGLGGCSSQLVGRWRTNNVGELGIPSGATTLVLVVNKDHTFAAMFQDRSGAAVAGYNGTWTQVAKSQVRFKPVDGPEGSGQLLDPLTMLATGQGVAFKLMRTE